MACACCKGRHEPYIRSSIPRASVHVSFGRASSPVRLAALCVRRANGRRLVRLVDVWWAASIPVYPARLRFDLFGDDGFTTAGKGSLPMSGTLLEHAVVDVDTRDVSWEIDVPCYFRIKGLVSVVARHDASALADDATAQPSESVSSHGSRSILTQWGSSDP